MKTKGLKKIKCEVCGNDDKEVLQNHHIKERTEIGTSNHSLNLICLCSNCHLFVHAGRLKIIGVFPSTNPPLGRTAVYELDGKKNIDIDESYFEYKSPQMKIYTNKNKK